MPEMRTLVEFASQTEYALTLFAERDHLPVFTGQTYDDHVDCWHVLAASSAHHHWAMAAIAASLERRCGARTDRSGKQTDIQRFCTDVGISRQHFHYLADTYRAFSAPRNTGLTGLIDSPELSFKHFAVAAKLAEDPMAAVIEAHDAGWSANVLEGELRRRRAGPFSLPEALEKLFANIDAKIASWPREVRPAVLDALNAHIDHLKSRVVPPLTPQELHALRWIQTDMENFPFCKRNFNDPGRGRGGSPEVSGGCGGARIFQTIVGDLSSAGRGDVLRAIQNLFAGVMTRTGELVLGVARELAAGVPSVVSQMELPPEAGGDLTGTRWEARMTTEDDVPEWVTDSSTDYTDPIGEHDEDCMELAS